MRLDMRLLASLCCFSTLLACGSAEGGAGGESGERPGAPAPANPPDVVQDDFGGGVPSGGGVLSSGSGGGTPPEPSGPSTGSGPPVPAPDACVSKAYGVSADDSNSMGSPAYARGLLQAALAPAPERIRAHEFLNYYRTFEVHDEATIKARATLVKRSASISELEEYDLHVVVGAGRPANRPPLSLTVALDLSGSMKGSGIALAKEAVTALAARLTDPADSLAVVGWSDAPRVLLEPVDGPSAGAALAGVFDKLETGGDSNIAAGLQLAYEVASKQPAEETRVVVISDGGANAGSLEVERAELAADLAGDDSVQLVGIGVGPVAGYNDQLMNALTDAGRGAYVYLDRAGEAERVLGERFHEVMLLAARNVSVSLTLPPGFDVAKYSGEDIVPSKEGSPRPQHLAVGDAMNFHMQLKRVDSCPLETQDIEVSVILNASPGFAFDAQPIPVVDITDGFELPAPIVPADAPGEPDELRSLYRSYARSRVVVAVAQALKTGLPADLEAAKALISHATDSARGDFAIEMDDEIAELRQMLEMYPAGGGQSP